MMAIRVHVPSVRVATGLREADGDCHLAVATARGLPGAGTCRRAAGVGGGEKEGGSSEHFEHYVISWLIFKDVFTVMLMYVCVG